MVVLSPNFTVLASLSALAVVSMLPTGAEAIALPSTPQRSSHSRRPNAATTEGRNGGNSYTPDVKGKDADSSSSPIPALSLPGLPKRGTFGVEHSPAIDKRWDPTNPLFELGDLWLGSGAPSKTRRDGHSDVVVSGTNDHVHVSHHYHGGKVVVSGDDEHVHLHRRSPMPDPHSHYHHNHGSHDTMVVSGDDDHVNVHMKRTPRNRHHHDDKIVVSGDHDHVNAHMRRSPHEHHGHHDKVVVSGNHDHVNAHMRRSPHEHHGHHDKVVVSGNHDHVDVHHKRSPHSHHHHGSVIVSGDDDHVNIHHKRAATRYRHYRPHFRRSPDGAVSQDDSGVSIPLLDKDRTLLVPSLQRRDPGLLGDDVVMTDHDTIVNAKRQVMSAFAEPEGVPGTIDIMSNVAGSSVGQRIASLTLSSTMGNDVLGNADPFVLNASGTNQTQIYMVVLPDDDDSSDPSSPSNSTGPAYTPPPSNSTSSANSTSPGNSTSTNAPSASFAPSSISSMDVDPTSNSTAPNNSTTPSNSTSSSSSTPSQYKKVALKIPLFDAESATMRAFCATFDPQPSAPSPLTVESCANGPLDDKHKSQVFAFDPSTGAIQPMWYEGGEGDGYTGDDGGDDGDDQDDTGDNTDTPPVDDSPTPANVTSTADVDSTVARIASLSDKLMDNDSTIRPPTPNVAAKAHAFAAGQYANAQNVTLMFAPLTPELSPHAASEERMAGSSSSPSSTSTTGSASATDTNASPDPVSTTITFSSASATSTSSPTDTSSSTGTAGTKSASVAFAPASATSTLSSASATDSSTAPSGSSTASDSPTATSSASATSTTDSTTSSATSSDASASLTVHSLGVEVFDPNATSSSSDVSSTAAATDSSSTVSSTSSVTSSVQAASAPTMTPYSTAPYEWMFKQSS